MRNIFYILTIIFIPFGVIAQNDLGKSDDQSRIVLNTFIPDDILENTPSARKLFISKLSQIATRTGMGGGEATANNRFIISGNLNILTKDILPGPPTKYLVSIEVTLAVGDGIDGKLFASNYVEFKGSGVSEDKAFIDAIKKINPRNTQIQEVLNLGKEKIIEYYNSRCDFILKEAEMLVSKNEFNSAISTLIAIPEVCKDCYDKAMNAVGPIYQKQIDRQCKIDLAEAKNAWNANQDNFGAERASVFLTKIDPNSSCFNEALNLSNSIAKRIIELDKREWNFKMKQQQDNVDIQKATINAARDIGVAYGNNQPKVVYNVRGWW